MHGFFFFCVIGATTAAHLGYHYEQVGQNVAVGGVEHSGNEIEAQGIDIRFGGDTLGAANALSSGLSGLNNNVANGFGGRNTNEIGAIGSGRVINNVANAQYSKEFYTYSAPEDEFVDHDNTQHIAGSLKKKLRVIFIKAPENQALTNAALQLAKQASEDRTAIYVLTKQADIGALANQLQTIKSNNAHKPEVHFVKYRTSEDALRAQQAIQAQYNALGGQTRNANEEVAPVLNFASSTAHGVGSGTTGTSFGGNSIETGLPTSSIQSGAYLPPTTRRA